MNNNDSNTIQLSDVERQEIVTKKATCPFIGTAVATAKLPVRNSITQPLSSIDDVIQLGNSGGGDLGEVLKVFAEGNHARMLDDFGKPDGLVPSGLFSLDFPGSPGSHPGHSGILQGNPKLLDSGRFSQVEFDRLISIAKDGFLKRSDVAKFIAENLVRDPESKVDSKRVAGLIIQDLGDLLSKTTDVIKDKFKKWTKTETDSTQSTNEKEFFEALTKSTGENNLVGSAGEFGLLFAFFANKPNAKVIDSEPTLSVEDLTLMFKDKKFPSGWETWKKTRSSWVKNTAHILIVAGKEFEKIKHG